MPRLRFWQPSDLPHLARMSVASTWAITPEDDKPHTTLEKVTANAHRALMGTLASPGGTAIVADEGGRPVGFLLVGIQPNEKTGEPAGYMADIWVEPEFRRHGLAEQMHYATEAYLKALGIRRASNWTHAHNPRGLSSSKRHGFQPWGVMMAKVLR